jgi:hypothetical protein
MRKDILLGVFLTLTICPLVAQQESEPTVNLSLGFANAALDATKAIRQCRGTMFLSEGGVAVPPDTQKTIDRAENAAKNEPERAVVDVLKSLFQARLNTNMGRAVASMYGTSTDCREQLTRQTDVEHAISASEMEQRRCRVALRFVLRRRLYLGTPDECRNLPPWDANGILTAK